MSKTLIVLAAGMGSRYGGLKQIDPVGPSGEAIMDYSVYDAVRAGFDRIVFVIRRDFEALFREKIGVKYAGSVAVDYAFQSLDDLPSGFAVPEGREKPWGTGQALYAARTLVKEPFAVINADDFYGRDGYEKLARRLDASQPGEYCMCAFEMDKTLSENGTVSRGVCRCDDRGFLVSVTEHTKLSPAPDGGVDSLMPDGSTVKFTGREPVSMNMWGFMPDIFEKIEPVFREFLAGRGGELKSEFYIPLLVSELIGSGQAVLKVETSASSWFGVTYREDKPRVVAAIAELVKSGAYPARLF